MIQLPKIINKAELARKLFPDNPSAPQLLNDKLKGSNRNKFSESDKAEAIRVIEEMLQELKQIKIQ